jgi:hypothetical protein
MRQHRVTVVAALLCCWLTPCSQSLEVKGPDMTPHVGLIPPQASQHHTAHIPLETHHCHQTLRCCHASRHVRAQAAPLLVCTPCFPHKGALALRQTHTPQQASQPDHFHHLLGTAGCCYRCRQEAGGPLRKVQAFYVQSTGYTSVIYIQGIGNKAHWAPFTTAEAPGGGQQHS